MFSNLIESGSHAADLKRKGRFFLGTIALYCLLLVATGIGSIYAYNVKLDEPTDLEVLALINFPPADARVEPEHHDTRPAATQNRVNQVATRIDLSYVTPYHSDRIAPVTARDIDPHTPVVIAPLTSDPFHPGGPAEQGVPGSIGNNPNGEDGPTV